MSTEKLRLRGFVLSRTRVREQDLSLKLLLEDGRAMPVLAPSALASRVRYAAGLSPLALYTFTISSSRKGFRLDEALVERPYVALLSDLKRQTAAMTATGLCDEVSEPAPTDRELFLLLGELYANLSERPREESAGWLVKFALEALAHAGHGIVLDRCVRCQTEAPTGALTTVDVTAGGVVCRGCGGGDYRLSALDRDALRRVQAGDLGAMREGLLSVTSALISGFAPRSAEVIGRVVSLF